MVTRSAKEILAILIFISYSLGGVGGVGDGQILHKRDLEGYTNIPSARAMCTSIFTTLLESLGLCLHLGFPEKKKKRES